MWLYKKECKKQKMLLSWEVERKRKRNAPTNRIPKFFLSRKK